VQAALGFGVAGVEVSVLFAAVHQLLRGLVHGSSLNVLGTAEAAFTAPPI
jgi:hypothetical protein